MRTVAGVKYRVIAIKLFALSHPAHKPGMFSRQQLRELTGSMARQLVVMLIFYSLFMTNNNGRNLAVSCCGEAEGFRKGSLAF